MLIGQFFVVGELNLLLVVGSGLALTAFSAMMLKDSPQSRKYFFYAFCVFMGCICLFGLYKTYQKTDEDVIAARCEELRKKGQFLHSKVPEQMEACKEFMFQAALTGITVVNVAVAFIFYHLIGVVHVYWKKKKKGRDGFVEQIDEEIFGEEELMEFSNNRLSENNR